MWYVCNMAPFSLCTIDEEEIWEYLLNRWEGTVPFEDWWNGGAEQIAWRGKQKHEESDQKEI